MRPDNTQDTYSSLSQFMRGRARYVRDLWRYQPRGILLRPRRPAAERSEASALPIPSSPSLAYYYNALRTSVQSAVVSEVSHAKQRNDPLSDDVLVSLFSSPSSPPPQRQIEDTLRLSLRNGFSDSEEETDSSDSDSRSDMSDADSGARSHNMTILDNIKERRVRRYGRHRFQYERSGVGADVLSPIGVFFSPPTKRDLTDTEMKEGSREIGKQFFDYIKGTAPICDFKPEDLPRLSVRACPRIKTILRRAETPRYYQITGKPFTIASDDPERVAAESTEKRRIVVSKNPPAALWREEQLRFKNYFLHILPQYLKDLGEVEEKAGQKWNDNKAEYIEMGFEDAKKYQNFAQNIYRFSSLLTDSPDKSPFYLSLMHALQVDNNPECASAMLKDIIEDLDEGQEIGLVGGGNIGAGAGISLSIPWLGGENLMKSRFLELNGTSDRHAEMVITKRQDKFHIRFRNTKGLSVDGLISPFNINVGPAGNDLVQDDVIALLALEASLIGRRVGYSSQMETIIVEPKKLKGFLSALEEGDVDEILELSGRHVHTMKEKGADNNVELAASADARTAFSHFNLAERNTVGVRLTQEIWSAGRVERQDTQPPYCGSTASESTKTHSEYHRLFGNGLGRSQLQTIFSPSLNLTPDTSTDLNLYSHEHTGTPLAIRFQAEANERVRTTLEDCEVTDTRRYEQDIYNFSGANLETQLELLTEAINKIKEEDSHSMDDVKAPTIGEDTRLIDTREHGPEEMKTYHPDEDTKAAEAENDSSLSVVQKLAKIIHDYDAPTEHMMGEEFRKAEPALHCAAFMLAQKKEDKKATTLKNSRTKENEEDDLLALYKKHKYNAVEVVVHTDVESRRAHVVQVEFKKRADFISRFKVPTPLVIALCCQGIFMTDAVVAIPSGITHGRDGRISTSKYAIPMINSKDLTSYRLGRQKV